MAVRATRDDNGFRELRHVLAAFPGNQVEAEFARIASRFLKSHGYEFLPAHRQEPLSGGECAALEAVGVNPQPAAMSFAPVMQTAASHAALVATALPLAAAARRIGVTDSRLRQRVAEGSLIAVRLSDNRSLAIPVFQLTGDGELPGLRVVLKAIRRDVRPIQVAAFFTTAQPDLESEAGNPMTPLDWLLDGHDPGPVADLAREI